MTSVHKIAGVQYLPWDSRFFGVETVQIVAKELDETTLRSLLEDVWSAGGQFVYWKVQRPEKSVVAAAISCGGMDVGTNVSFVGSVRNFRQTDGEMTHVLPYDAHMGQRSVLDEIAIDCGQHSRFRVDGRLPIGKADEMYRQWIANSLDRSFADETLVAIDDREIAGLVTVTADDQRGRIGLLGVRRGYRGKSVGKSLVRAAMNWFQDRKCKVATVVTQQRNEAACSLYERYFDGERESHTFFHFRRD